MESVFISPFLQRISARCVFLRTYCKPRPRYFHGKRTAARAAVEDDAVESSCKVVTISHEKLLDRDANLFEEIEAGFGRNGLGIIAISKVPNFPTLRKNLLHLSHRLAALPEEAKKQLEDPDSRYSFGWSHGKEKLESGQPDKWKGSFYANPVVDIPTTDEILLQRYKTYCRPNLWPRNTLPELEPAFKDLGNLIFTVGLLVAYHCDKYVSKHSPQFEESGLKALLQHSLSHKGRLLHYFPVQESHHVDIDDEISSWCGWHTDHSALTGLTFPMYMKNGLQVASSDGKAGLYIQSRSGMIVKAVYEKDDIAYQLGEAAEILSNGLLHATPHCVKTPEGKKACGFERNTFALFMQPNWDEPFHNLNSIIRLHRELESHVAQVKETLTFGDYSEMLLNKYYDSRLK